MPSPFQLRFATRLLRHGGILAHPTEAVYGLACDPLNPNAVLRLLTLKNRPLEKGLILIAAEWEQLLPFVRLTEPLSPSPLTLSRKRERGTKSAARSLSGRPSPRLFSANNRGERKAAFRVPAWLAPVLASWPGPHTWLLPAAEWLPAWINGGGDRVAVRVTAHPLAAELCRRFGGPLVSTSANRTGRPPARTPLQVRLRCPGVDLVLHGATSGLARPTPIRDALTGEKIRP